MLDCGVYGGGRHYLWDIGWVVGTGESTQGMGDSYAWRGCEYADVVGSIFQFSILAKHNKHALRHRGTSSGGGWGSSTNCEANATTGPQHPWACGLL
jgi:hypothetical protein